jgi:hypothetical protein
MAGVSKPPGIAQAVVDIPDLPHPPPTPPGIPIPFPNISAHFETVPALPVINTLFHDDPITIGPLHSDFFLLV